MDEAVDFISWFPDSGNLLCLASEELKQVNLESGASRVMNLALGYEVLPTGGKLVIRGARLIDDSYNSSPAALSRALESGRQIAAERHWAVLGQMLELGDEAPEMHFQAGREAAQLGFSPILGVGELAREIVRGAQQAGAEALWFADATAAVDEVAERLREGDLLLVKGSRGVALDTLVAAVLDREGDG